MWVVSGGCSQLFGLFGARPDRLLNPIQIEFSMSQLLIPVFPPSPRTIR